MRQAIGVALGLCGLAFFIVPVTATLWAARHASGSVAQTGTTHLTVLIVAGVACLVASYALLRR